MMYASLWSHLPGPFVVRLLLALVMFAIVVVLLFLFVFPWVDSHLHFDETHVNDAAQPAATHR